MKAEDEIVFEKVGGEEELQPKYAAPRMVMAIKSTKHVRQRFFSAVILFT